MLKKLFTVFLSIGFLVNISAAQVMTMKTGHEGIPKSTFASQTTYGINSNEVMIDLHTILEQLKKMDPDKQINLNNLCQQHLGLSLECSIDEFEAIINQYPYEIEFGDWQDLTPGCFSHWIMAFLGVFVLTPYVTYYALLSIYDGEQSCFGKYACWAITGFSLAFSSWTKYRICAEEHKENPDMDVISDLNEDNDYLLKMSLVTFIAGAAFDVDCEENYLWSDN